MYTKTDLAIAFTAGIQTATKFLAKKGGITLDEWIDFKNDLICLTMAVDDEAEEGQVEEVVKAVNEWIDLLKG